MAEGQHKSIWRGWRLLLLLICTALVIQSACHWAFLAGQYLHSQQGTVVADEEWPTVDIVYTWVNGSDPVHQASLAQLKQAHGMLAACNGSVEDCDVDSIATASRFQDNEELRYSLRTIEKFVPWARHIFIVTNGQVPHWLDVEHPRITLVTHDDIYANKSHLPTFSSPSIESHLHHIPGLAKNFIYFNDDVMIGRHLSRDDFYTESAGTKIYLSWPVPLCKQGCISNFLGDGVCDEKCNVTECEFDHGDCINPTEFRGKRAKSKAVDAKDERSEFYCATACPDNWVGDKHCDRPCNVPSCAYDAGDCGLSDLTAIVPSHTLSREREINLPLGITAVQLEMSDILGDGKVLEVYHDNNKLIRTATMAQSYKRLIITFHKGIAESEVTIQMKGTFQSDVEEELSWVIRHCTSDECLESARAEKARTKAVALRKETCQVENWWDNMCANQWSTIQVESSVVGKPTEGKEEGQEAEAVAYKGDPQPALEQDSLFEDLEERLQKMGGFPAGRHLLDMFADSLRHTSHKLTKKFGAMERKVPAHMPHMINKDIVEELHQILPEEFEKTSQNRLRSADDIQFALSYFYYLIQRPPRFTLEEKFEELDVDQDGLLSHNELRTIAVRIYGNNPLDEDLFSEMERSLRDHSRRWDKGVDLSALLATEPVRTELEEWYSNRLIAKWEKMGTDEVAFLRINQNDTELQSRLDGIRERQHLFICLNDDIEHDDPRASDAVALLHEFYESLVPLPSAFELAATDYHQSTYIQDIRTELRWRKLQRIGSWVVVGLVLFVSMVWLQGRE